VIDESRQLTLIQKEIHFQHFLCLPNQPNQNEIQPQTKQACIQSDRWLIESWTFIQTILLSRLKPKVKEMLKWNKFELHAMQFIGFFHSTCV
jgi:hypothetical protein